MENLNHAVQEYHLLLQKGTLQKAYRGLMEYLMSLRTFLQNKYPDYATSNSVYFGYMDMSYFSFYPESLKKLGLKVAIVFLHQACRFEVWLAGCNKKVQKRVWEHIRKSAWKKYHLVPELKGSDAILEHILMNDPDFSDLDGLTQQIEKKTVCFIRDIESFLSEKPVDP